jgi:hypothetical protein
VLFVVTWFGHTFSLEAVNILLKLVVVFFGDFFQFRNIHKPGEVVEVEHVLVLAMFAKERHLFAEIHVLEMVGDKAAVAALNALAEFLKYFFRVFHSIQF